MIPLYVSKSPIAGQGLYVGHAVKKGQRIAVIQGKIKRKVNKSAADALSCPNWIGIGKDTWIDPIKPFKFINHSCEPTAGIRGTRTLVALRDMESGEEITIDYGTTERDLNWWMDCSCGAELCRHIIGPIGELPRDRFDAYNPNLPTYFKRIYMKRYGIGNAQKLPPWNKIRLGPSRIHGVGVLAARDIKKGEVIFIIKGSHKKFTIKSAKDSKQGPNWIGLQTDVWIDPFPPATFLNHSCDPNAGIQGSVTLVAMQDIPQGEEITFDYSTTEDDKFWSFDCDCGAPNCRKCVKAIQSLPRQVFFKYLPVVPKYFQKQYLRYNREAYDR